MVFTRINNLFTLLDSELYFLTLKIVPGVRMVRPRRAYTHVSYIFQVTWLLMRMYTQSFRIMKKERKKLVPTVECNFILFFCCCFVFLCTFLSFIHPRSHFIIFTSIMHISSFLFSLSFLCYYSSLFIVLFFYIFYRFYFFLIRLNQNFSVLGP